MSAIEVERIGVGSSDSRHVYEVIIDGRPHGCVKCGETRIFDVPPGIHTVKFALDLYNSPPVKVVVGMGKTSLICRTGSRRRFPFFGDSQPTTRILVREEAEAFVPPPAPDLDETWRKPAWAHAAVRPDMMAAD